MSFIADAHREWHTVHGARATCPLDCGASEPTLEEIMESEEWSAQQDRRAKWEAARQEAIATGRTVKVGP